MKPVDIPKEALIGASVIVGSLAATHFISPNAGASCALAFFFYTFFRSLHPVLADIGVASVALSLAAITAYIAVFAPQLVDDGGSGCLFYRSDRACLRAFGTGAAIPLGLVGFGLLCSVVARVRAKKKPPGWQQKITGVLRQIARKHRQIRTRMNSGMWSDGAMYRFSRALSTLEEREHRIRERYGRYSPEPPKRRYRKLSDY